MLVLDLEAADVQPRRRLPASKVKLKRVTESFDTTTRGRIMGDWNSRASQRHAGVRAETLAAGARAAFFAVPFCIVIGGNLGMLVAVAYDFMVPHGPGVSVAPLAVVGAVVGLLLSPLASVALLRTERKWAADKARL